MSALRQLPFLNDVCDRRDLATRLLTRWIDIAFVAERLTIAQARDEYRSAGMSWLAINELLLLLMRVPACTQ